MEWDRDQFIKAKGLQEKYLKARLKVSGENTQQNSNEKADKTAGKRPSVPRYTS